MKEDGKKSQASEHEDQDEDQQVTNFSHGFGRVELIVLPQLEVMARLSSFPSS